MTREELIQEAEEKGWFFISTHQKLSEDFIRDFQDKVDWLRISKYQKLSEEFIREFQDKVGWPWISIHQKLSEEFIREFNLEIPKDSWLYKSENFKKKEVRKTKLYKIYKDYFIAFKGIRSDWFSNFNFQYKYEIGKVFESHADFSNYENSFGLSAWTLKEARDYCDEKIIKVKIFYKDVAHVVHEGGKIRCTKFEVLEEVENDKE